MKFFKLMTKLIQFFLFLLCKISFKFSKLEEMDLLKKMFDIGSLQNDKLVSMENNKIFKESEKSIKLIMMVVTRLTSLRMSIQNRA